MAVFPVYVRDDSGDVTLFSSFEDMQGYLEPIDIKNHEYAAWDAEGRVLDLAVGKPKSEWLKLSRACRTMSHGEFAEIKSKAVPYRRAEPLLRSLGRRLGMSKG